MKIGEWTLRSHRVVTPSGVRPADVLIREHSILALSSHDDRETSGVILDVGDRLVFPGLVAFHALPRASGDRVSIGALTHASSRAGVSTIIDPPADLGPLATNVGSFASRLDKVPGLAWVDCGATAMLTPKCAGEVALLLDAGALGIKAWLGPEGFDGQEAVREVDLRRAMTALARAGRALMAVVPPAGPDREADSIRRLIELARETGAAVHLHHFQTVNILEEIRRVRASKLDLTLDVSVDELLDESSTIRDHLWSALGQGQIDAIGASRSAMSPGLDLPRIWTEASRRGIAAEDLAKWLARGPAEAAGLSGRKGIIAPGFEADLIAFDPEAQVETDRGRAFGKVEVTVLRGLIVPTSAATTITPRGIVALPLDSTLAIASGLDRLNHLTEAEAVETFRHCSGSARWAWRVSALRPYTSESDLLAAADRLWQALEPANRIEALANQAPMSLALAPEETRAGLSNEARDYEKRFGFPFVLSVEPGTQSDPLSQLRRRMNHSQETEKAVAVEELGNLIAVRLRKLLS